MIATKQLMKQLRVVAGNADTASENLSKLIEEADEQLLRALQGFRKRLQRL